jgi:hypothetical protein
MAKKQTATKTVEALKHDEATRKNIEACASSPDTKDGDDGIAFEDNRGQKNPSHRGATRPSSWPDEDHQQDHLKAIYLRDGSSPSAKSPFVLPDGGEQHLSGR